MVLNALMLLILRQSFLLGFESKKEYQDFKRMVPVENCMKSSISLDIECTERLSSGFYSNLLLVNTP